MYNRKGKSYKHNNNIRGGACRKSYRKRTLLTVNKMHAEILSSIRTSVTVDEVHAESFKNIRTTVIRGAFRKF